jgi:hypothetical protein
MQKSRTAVGTYSELERFEKKREMKIHDHVKQYGRDKSIKIGDGAPTSKGTSVHQRPV